MVTEQKRLNEARESGVPWKKWGPYLSERQWGTVREDYSKDGNAWDYFTHDQSRSRAYRWGEDGLAGISDDKQRLCFALALWNGRDPILKERLFGLTNSEGNHGEDVKEYYFYLDSTPTHSYMKYLYKYPQSEYPYRDLVETNRRRSREELEYELLDTGIFDEDRYFDVFVEYAKADPEDIADPRSRSTIAVRKPPRSTCFRRCGSATRGPGKRARQSRCCVQIGEGQQFRRRIAQLGEYTLQCEGAPELLFTENETNASRLWGQPNRSPYVKDAFHEYVIAGNAACGESRAHRDQGCGASTCCRCPGWRQQVVRLRLSAKASRRRIRDLRSSLRSSCLRMRTSSTTASPRNR